MVPGRVASPKAKRPRVDGDQAGDEPPSPSEGMEGEGDKIKENGNGSLSL